MPESFPILISVAPENADRRLDQFLTTTLSNVSRARVQELIAEGKVLVNDSAAKASLKLRGGERVTVLGDAQRAPLKASPEDIPLDIVYEDDDLAVINKSAGMMVHAGAGATDDARNRGTLVNALLHHMRTLSGVGGDLRPGIVHRLDKETSGLIVVAKSDETHRQLSAQFAAREVKKKYVALVHGWVKKDSGTITQEYQPGSHPPYAHDHTARRRTRRRHALQRNAPSGYQVWKIYFAGCENRYRTHSSDSCPHGDTGASSRRRYDVWCAKTGSRTFSCNQPGAKFPTLRAVGIRPSPHLEDGCPAQRIAGRTARVSREDRNEMKI